MLFPLPTDVWSLEWANVSPFLLTKTPKDTMEEEEDIRAEAMAALIGEEAQAQTQARMDNLSEATVIGVTIPGDLRLVAVSLKEQANEKFLLYKKPPLPCAGDFFS
jgi:hypothetical protein